MTGFGWVRPLWWLVPLLLVAAAVYEAVLAIGESSIASGGVPGEDVMGGVAFLVMLAGAALALLSRVLPQAPVWAVASFPPAAAAFVAARFYTYDPYFAPDLRRYSEGGAVSAAQILVLLAISPLVGFLTWRVPRIGSVVTAIFLIVAVLTAGFTLSH